MHSTMQDLFFADLTGLIFCCSYISASFINSFIQRFYITIVNVQSVQRDTALTVLILQQPKGILLFSLYILHRQTSVNNTH